MTLSRRDKTINALESLYKVWHAKVDLEKIFGDTAPEKYEITNFCRETLPKMVEEYYGSTPLKRNTDIYKDTVRVSIKELSDLAIINSNNKTVANILSLRVHQLKKYINDPIEPNLPRYRNYANFSNCFFSGTDLRNKLISGFCFAGSSFRESKFKGLPAASSFMDIYR